MNTVLTGGTKSEEDGVKLRGFVGQVDHVIACGIIMYNKDFASYICAKGFHKQLKYIVILTHYNTKHANHQACTLATYEYLIFK